jgi:hypothetical protein
MNISLLPSRLKRAPSSLPPPLPFPLPSADAEVEQRVDRPQSAGRSASPVKMLKRPARHEKETASLGETEAGGYVLAAEAAAEATAAEATAAEVAAAEVANAGLDAGVADAEEGVVEVALGGLEEKEEEEGKDGSKGGGEDDENGVVEVEVHSDAGMLEASDPGLDKVSPDAALGEVDGVVGGVVDGVVDGVVEVDVGGPAPSSARSAREMAQAYTSKELKDMALTLGVSQAGKKVDVCHRILTARAASRGGPAE